MRCNSPDAPTGRGNARDAGEIRVMSSPAYRGACHRARIRATRWLMRLSGSLAISPRASLSASVVGQTTHRVVREFLDKMSRPLPRSCAPRARSVQTPRPRQADNSPPCCRAATSIPVEQAMDMQPRLRGREARIAFGIRFQELRVDLHKFVQLRPGCDIVLIHVAEVRSGNPMGASNQRLQEIPCAQVIRCSRPGLYHSQIVISHVKYDSEFFSAWRHRLRLVGKAVSTRKPFRLPPSGTITTRTL